MISIGVIQEYIADINLSVQGYNVYYIITKQKEKSTSTESTHVIRTKTFEYLDRLGDILAEIEVLRETSIFRVATREVLMDEEIAGKALINTTASLLETGFIEKVVLATTIKGFRYRVQKNRSSTLFLLLLT
jgi:hypothetical protein